MKWEIVLLLVKFYLVISTRIRWLPNRVVWSAGPVQGRFPSRLVWVPYHGHDEYTGPVQGNSPFPSRVDWVPQPDQYEDESDEESSPFPSVGECAKVPSFSKVAGGVKTEEYPFTAGIEGFLVQNEYYNYRNRELRVFCGGSVITNIYVLTAAHCVEGDEWKPVNIRLGDVDLRTNHHKTFPIEKIIVHEQYESRRETKVHDIALIKVRQDIVFNDFIKPLCLPWNTARKSYYGEHLELAGFGATETSYSSTRKRMVELRVVDCTYHLNSNYICAIGDHGEDSCKGDSGGSLVAEEDGIYVSVGIVSYGLTRYCKRTRTPGVYTKTSKYLDWIESKVE